MEEKNEHESCVTFCLTDDLPNVCVVCGASATGQSSLQVDLPLDAETKARTLVQLLGLLFGFLYVWWRTSPGPPELTRLRLPHCDDHGWTAVTQPAVTITAVSRYTVEICGASAEFRQGLESLNAPPSPELLADLDAGPGRDADEFLKNIDKSAVRTPDDYLKDLERETGNG